MKFVVIYPNTDEAKNAIFAKLVEWSKKVDFEKQGIQANHFKVVKNWPSQNELINFPLNLQVEEVEIKDEKILSIRKLVIDADMEIVKEVVEAPKQNIEAPKENLINEQKL